MADVLDQAKPYPEGKEALKQLDAAPGLRLYLILGRFYAGRRLILALYLTRALRAGPACGRRLEESVATRCRSAGERPRPFKNEPKINTRGL